MTRPDGWLEELADALLDVIRRAIGATQDDYVLVPDPTERTDDMTETETETGDRHAFDPHAMGPLVVPPDRSSVRVKVEDRDTGDARTLDFPVGLVPRHGDQLDIGLAGDETMSDRYRVLEVTWTPDHADHDATLVLAFETRRLSRLDAAQRYRAI